MTSWTITFDSTVVTFPRKPERVEVRKSANITSLTIPGEEPFLLSMGVEARSLSLSGTLYGAEKNILITLLDGVYKTVQISGLDTQYDGTYILREVSWSHSAPNIFSYTIQLEAGSELISL